jgi:exodeoxyribonuclease VII small subunit
MEAKTEITALSFEAAMKQLEHIVEKLEGQEVTLAESLQLYRQGVALAEHLNSKLTEAQGLVKLLTRDAKGALTEAPFTADLEDASDDL